MRTDRMRDSRTALNVVPIYGRRPIRLRRFLLAFLLIAISATIVPAAALAASAATSPATKVHQTSAVLNGHLDPSGDPGVVDCDFEWGETALYGNVASCKEGSAFGAPADVSASLGSLAPGTTYHFRLSIETTSSGTLQGADQSFTTIPTPTGHPLVVAFGDDGTSASDFNPGLIVFQQQVVRKVFVASDGLIHGFDVVNPSTHTPLGGNFPVKPPTVGQVVLGVDDTALPSAGHLFYRGQDFPVFGFDSSGALLGGNFPIDSRKDPGFPDGRDAFARSNLCGVAVDSAGNIWLANSLNSAGNPLVGERILKYNAAGVYQAFAIHTDSLDKALQNGPCQLAFDSKDNLYAATEETGIWKYTAASGYAAVTKVAEAQTVSGGRTKAIAVNQTTDDLYVAREKEIEIIDEGGSSLEVFSPPQIAAPNFRGIAVDETNGNMYVADSGTGKVYVFEPGLAVLALPTVTTEAASAVTGSSATLNAFVDPEGIAVSSCKFEWGTTISYGKSAPCSPSPGSGSGDVAVSANLSDLTPETTYHFRIVATNSNGTVKGSDSSFTTPPPPEIGGVGVSDVGFDTATLSAQVNPRGFATTYRFEYGPTVAYGSKAPIPDGDAGSGTSDVPASVVLDSLSEDTTYHFRVVAQSVNGTTTTKDATFTTTGPPLVEAVGTPIRSMTSAQLGGRVYPSNAATTYHFEYGDQGPCSSNPCTSTPDRSAGLGGVVRLVGEEVEDLEPGTTYYYRLLADNGHPSGSAVSEGRTVTTRSSEAPLSHGAFPGPPGSDRAYEQISLPDSSGNPVGTALAFSDDGKKAMYRFAGGTSLSTSGTPAGLYLSERTEEGWQAQNVTPGRDDLAGQNWTPPATTSDLSNIVVRNFDFAGVNDAISHHTVWRLGSNPTKLVDLSPPERYIENDLTFVVPTSDDTSRVVVGLSGAAFDPAHPEAASEANLYDISNGEPHLVSFLPGEGVPSCGVNMTANAFGFVREHSLSPDGDHLYFPSRGNSCSGPSHMYVRDLEAGQTSSISGSPISGPACSASLLGSTEESAFLWTQTRLDPVDTEPSSCATGGSSSSDGDIYRYDSSDEGLECVTCVADEDADVILKLENPGANREEIAVAGDGSRVYFSSSATLLPGAASEGVYRVNVQNEELAYVGIVPEIGNAELTPDGSVLVFRSKNAALNPVGGTFSNGGTEQFFRYDDDDRSLVCISCPQDGSSPASAARMFSSNGGRNLTPMVADGGIVAFATPTPLLPADQNTPENGGNPGAGTDIYEWRDGRLLLVTDGLTGWQPGGGEPDVAGISPSGQDVYFIAPVQYTPDALDGYHRLYTARIGGGFEFAKPLAPCSLEVCQGTPRGAPDDPVPASAGFSGPGNSEQSFGAKPSKCPKGRRKVRRAGKVRCVKKPRKSSGKRAKRHNRANDDRRQAR